VGEFDGDKVGKVVGDIGDAEGEFELKLDSEEQFRHVKEHLSKINCWLHK
jgi:hypothetical protein